MEIKNIVFDLGGVLLNIDYERTIDAFKKLGVKDFDSIFTQASQLKLFDSFDKGQISAGEFRDGLRSISGLPAADQEIDNAWNAMLLDFPATRLALLEGVRKRYRIFLLSNTNAIHYPAYSRALEEKYGFAELSSLFEKQYLSYRIGMRKPDREIFEFVLSDNGILPEETLFIDDTLQHVHGAEAAGIHAFHLDPAKTGIEDLFTVGHRLIIPAGK